MVTADQDIDPQQVNNPPFSRIHAEHREAVLSYLRARVRTSVAEDLTQEVFRKAERGLSTFRGDATIRTWLLRIATRTMLDHVRSRQVRDEKRTDALPEPDVLHASHVRTPEALIAPAEAPRVVVRQEMHACIREYVDRLPPKYREVIVLRDLDGLSNAQMAQRLSVGVAAAKIRLHRAREALGRLLREDCEFHATESGLGCDRRPPVRGPVTAPCSCRPPATGKL